VKIENSAKLILKSQRGFSLVEILVALVLLGLIGTVVVPQVTNQLERGRLDTTKIVMRQLTSQLKAFKRDCNRYPTTSQGLDALEQKPGDAKCPNYQPGGYFDEDSGLPEDGWGQPFEYESDGRKFDIISFGSDNEEGGEEFDADIHSKDFK